MEYGAESKPKCFALLLDLSASAIRQINNIVGSIKTKPLYTSTPFDKLTKVLIFFRAGIFSSGIERLSTDCCNVCPVYSTL